MDFETRGEWLSIFDYSLKTDTSISTVRRRIKEKKIEFKKEKGKFWIWFKSEPATLSAKYYQEKLNEYASQIERLERENSELKKMLRFREQRIEISEGPLRERLI